MSGKPRQSNADRRRERDECRLRLSQHINEQLSVLVKPSEVRLNPRPQDAYAWRPMPGHEQLFAPIFAKNLSDHSIGTYRLLVKQVGATFEAIHQGPTDTGGTTVLLPNAQPSFSLEIERLTSENAGLSERICQLSSALESEVEQNTTAKANNAQLCDRLRLAETQLRKYSRTAGYVQETLSKNFVELEKSLPILAELCQEADIDSPAAC